MIIVATRYCSRQTYDELMAGGRAEQEAGFEGRAALTFDPVRSGFTRWLVVDDDDPRMNTVVE